MRRIEEWLKRDARLKEEGVEKKEKRKKLVRMNLKSLPLEEKRSGNEIVGIFWRREHLRFGVVRGTIHGRTCELGADKWLMPAYANQDYPSRGIIDSFGRDQIFWESNSLHGIIFVSNTIFDNGKFAQFENNKK